jgi:4'-phosphopantetheinyl transferase
MPEALQWSQPTRCLDLGSGEIHVWRVFPEDIEGDANLERLLSPEERMVQRRFLCGSSRRSFAAHRGLLRCLLGRYLRMDPASVQIQRGPHGKPELISSGRSEPLHFSLSHTRGLSLFAFSRLGAVGVDVEFIDSNLDPERMAAWILLPAARSRLMASPSAEKVAAFHSAWTVQEACAKAVGLGLGPSLAGPEGMVLLEVAEHAEMAGGLAMMMIDAGPGYAAALACRGKSFILKSWQWPHARQAALRPPPPDLARVSADLAVPSWVPIFPKRPALG